MKRRSLAAFSGTHREAGRGAAAAKDDAWSRRRAAAEQRLPAGTVRMCFDCIRCALGAPANKSQLSEAQETDVMAGHSQMQTAKIARTNCIHARVSCRYILLAASGAGAFMRAFVALLMHAVSKYHRPRLDIM